MISMETRFPAIQDLTVQRVRNVVRRALRAGLDAELVGEFLASTDWGAFESADPKVAAMLGQMEAWATGYAEGELTRAQYVARLLSLLPRASERSRRLVMGAGEIRVTAPESVLVAGAAALERPRTVSGTLRSPATA